MTARADPALRQPLTENLELHRRPPETANADGAKRPPGCTKCKPSATGGPDPPGQKTEAAGMYPTSTLVATAAADRRRQAQTAHGTRRRTPAVGALAAVAPVCAALIQLASLVTGGRANGANDYGRR